jgi:tetratricopeptide (TPR) repeat protein
LASNPRIDDLRRRLEADPGSRLFAQLAEELRKAGEADEAVEVARRGLQKHPTYTSARMTLGRGLLDMGDAPAARREFETVLKGAPDNILASRFLAQALEAVGDLERARGQYQATLGLAPGDRQTQAELEALEQKLRAAGAGPGPAPGASGPDEAEPPPIPVVAEDGPWELERSLDSTAGAPVASAESGPPIDRPSPVPVESRGPGGGAPAYEREESFDFDEAEDNAEPPAESAYDATVPPLTAVPAYPDSSPTPPLGTAKPDAASTQELDPAAVMASARRAARVEVSEIDDADLASRDEASRTARAGPEAGPLVSPTLAELYLEQGFADRACDVYRELVRREPANSKARARLAELEAALAAPPAPKAAQREVLERTIAHLEGFLAVVRARRG